MYWQVKLNEKSCELRMQTVVEVYISPHLLKQVQLVMYLKEKQ